MSTTTPLIVPSTTASVAAAAAASSVRGGGDDDANNNKKKEDSEVEKTVEELQEDALKNISNCYRLAITAGVLGTASVLWESYKRTNIAFNLNLKEQGDLLVNLFDFVFGAGLFQVYQLFQQQYRGDVDRMSPPNFLRLVQTLSRLWLGVTAMFAIDAVGLAYDLKVGSKFVGIATALMAINLPLGEWFHRISLQKEESPLPEVATDYAPARRVGLSASRNMIWVVGSIAFSAIIETTDFTIKTIRAKTTEDKAGIVIEGLVDLSESFVIGGLLASLYKTLLRAVIMATKRHFNDKDPAFKEYYQAQTKFYGRVASFFGWQALFTVLGHVAQVCEKLWFKYAGK